MGVVLDNLTALDLWLTDLRAQGRQLVTTNGCFDLVHVGHLRYLQWARSHGDVLLVCVNTDRSVRALKGEKRPIVPEADRAELLAGFSCVDGVVLFDEDTPEALLRHIRPNVHVKGGQYTLETLPEAPTLLAVGARVVFAPMSEGHSTSTLIERVASRYATGSP